VVVPGSFALQLAADHPDRVSRLVVAGRAHRPGPVDRRVQQDVADLAAGGSAGAPSGRSPLSPPSLRPVGRSSEALGGSRPLLRRGAAGNPPM